MVWSTIGGDGMAGHSDEGVGQFHEPTGVAVDPTGSTVYVADLLNHRIRKLSGEVWSTVGGDGTEGDSDMGFGQFKKPLGLAISKPGTVHVADSNNHLVRKLSADGWSTIGGSSFNYSVGVAVDSSGDVYVADSLNHRIQKLSGEVWSTIGGDGSQGHSDGELGQFDTPYGVAVDSAGAVYVADRKNHSIRKLSGPGGVWSTIGGDGTAGYHNTGLGQFNEPTGVAVDSSGAVYVADSNNHLVRKLKNGVWSTIGGDGTEGRSDAGMAQFKKPFGVAVDSSYAVSVADSGNNCIRKLSGKALHVRRALLFTSLDLHTQNQRLLFVVLHLCGIYCKFSFCWILFHNSLLHEVPCTASHLLIIPLHP